MDQQNDGGVKKERGGEIRKVPTTSTAASTPTKKND
jgi:hypothetical protein